MAAETMPSAIVRVYPPNQMALSDEEAVEHASGTDDREDVATLGTREMFALFLPPFRTGYPEGPSTLKEIEAAARRVAPARRFGYRVTTNDINVDFEGTLGMKAHGLRSARTRSPSSAQPSLPATTRNDSLPQNTLSPRQRNLEPPSCRSDCNAGMTRSFETIQDEILILRA